MPGLLRQLAKKTHCFSFQANSVPFHCLKRRKNSPYVKSIEAFGEASLLFTGFHVNVYNKVMMIMMTMIVYDNYDNHDDCDDYNHDNYGNYDSEDNHDSFDDYGN